MQDQKHGNWWLSMGSNHTLVGYWPAELFSSLAYGDNVQWGGEIVDSHSFRRHTATQMGSGRFADEGFGKSSYFRNMEIVVTNNTFEPVQEVVLLAPDYEFYNIKKIFRDDWGTYIFYGGPGFSRTHSHSGVTSLVLNWFSFYLSFMIFLII